MTVNKNVQVQPAAAEFTTNTMKYARGIVTLALGVATENVRGFPASAVVMVTRANPAGGQGNLSAFYNSATGNISFASDDATEASDLYWILID